MKILVQTQLSNYGPDGKFDLACDSGWQMVMGRIRIMLDLDEDLKIDVMCPFVEDCVLSPYEINKDLFEKFGSRLAIVQHKILPNALATRYDFDYAGLSQILQRHCMASGFSFSGSCVKAEKYDVVYLNDPMHLRNFRAMFFNSLKYVPKFVVHSHFIDEPSCPKFPVEASLWIGQCEAARRADLNFWQCQSALTIFLNEMSKEYKEYVVGDVASKSVPWDDGYSSTEINSSIDMSNVRIDVQKFKDLSRDKVVLFVPNRIGDGKRSSDYTNCGKFMFEILPELRKLRDDFVVVCGNPNQKISNGELVSTSSKHGYISVVPNSLNRDEYKWIAGEADIAVGLYTNDSYGGTSSRELLDLDCLPLWVDNYEYSRLAKKSGWSLLAKTDLSDVHVVASELIDHVKMCKHVASNNSSTLDDSRTRDIERAFDKLRMLSYYECSYESTTPFALKKIKSLL